MLKRLSVLSAVFLAMYLGAAAQTVSGAAPVSNAGANQEVAIGATVELDGSGSTDANGNSLTYQWSLVTVPSGSGATLNSTTAIRPTFILDLSGTYVAQLIVSDGISSGGPAQVIISTVAIPPIANAGANQEVAIGATVELDGSGSTDANGNSLTYQWSLVSFPTGTGATLSSTTAIRPTFILDLPGTYVAQLVVTDGMSSSSSSPAQVTISTVARPPTANPGSAQFVTPGATVALSGSGSTDPNGAALTYLWSLISVPSGSNATLNGAATVNPSFTADIAGNYVAQLIVSDSFDSSAPATALISTTNLPPIANAGTTVAVPTGTIVGLNGSASSDPQGLPLTYSWALLSIPSGSAAVLSNATAAKPTFTADLPGMYVAQLIVNNGIQSSQPQTVVINALFPPAVTITLLQSSLITYSYTYGGVHISNPAVNTGGAACAGQVIEISLDDGGLGTLSTPTANPATSVCIPTGKQDASFTLTSNSETGSTSVSGFFTNFQTGTNNFSVSPRQINLSFDTISVGQGRTANGTVTLANPAPVCLPASCPSPGGVTINLASDESGIASLSASSVTIDPGKTSATFQINALAIGQANISATAVQAGYAGSSVAMTVLPPTLTITIPQALAIGPGQSVPFPISIGGPAAAPVTVNLTTTAGPGSATFSPSSVTIPAGATSPVTQSNIIGGALGNVTVQASASGYAPDVETETISVTLTLNPNSVTVQAAGVNSTVNSPTLGAVNPNTIATVQLNTSSVAPAAGLAIYLAVADPTVASVPATVIMPAGASAVSVNVRGVAVGNTTLTASGANGIVGATAPVQVYSPPTITLGGWCSGTLGLNVVTSGGCVAYLQAPALAGGEMVTFTSSNPSLVTLSLDPTVVGSRSVYSNVAGGYAQTSGVYLAALASSGTVTLTASAPGYTSASTTVTLTPSGFVINTGQNPYSTTTFSGSSNVSVLFAGLDPVSLNPNNGWATLRAGAPSVTINLKDDNTNAGTLGASSVTLTPGNYMVTTTYNPANPGTSNISIPSAPAGGYTQPSAGDVTTQFVVSAPSISLGGWCSGPLGLNQVSGGCVGYFGAPTPAGGETVTFTSSNPSLLTLSLDPTATGSKSVTVNSASGANNTGANPVYLAALASSGTVTLTASAPGYTISSASFLTCRRQCLTH